MADSGFQYTIGERTVLRATKKQAFDSVKKMLAERGYAREPVNVTAQDKYPELMTLEQVNNLVEEMYFDTVDYLY